MYFRTLKRQAIPATSPGPQAGILQGSRGRAKLRATLESAYQHSRTAIRGRAIRLILPLLIIAIAAAFLLPQVTDISDSIGTLTSLAWWAVGLALAAQVLSNLGFAYLTKSTVRLFGVRLTMGRSAELALAASSASVVAGGQVAYSGLTVRWLRHEGVTTEEALLTSFLPSILSLLTVVVISVVGMSLLTTGSGLPVPEAPVIGVGIVSLLGLALITYSSSKQTAWWTRLTCWIARTWQRLRRRPYSGAETAAMLGRVARAERLVLRRWKGPVLGNLVCVGFDMLSVYALFLAVHQAVNPGLLLAGYGLPALAGQLSIVPGGLGVVEGSMAAVYGSLGVPGNEAAAVVIAYRLLAFWLPLALGFGFLLLLEGRRQHAEPDASICEKLFPASANQPP